MIRDIVRKNYIMYYTQENLLDLKAEQDAEVQRLEAEDDTLKVRSIFERWHLGSIHNTEPAFWCM